MFQIIYKRFKCGLNFVQSAFTNKTFCMQKNKFNAVMTKFHRSTAGLRTVMTSQFSPLLQAVLAAGKTVAPYFVSLSCSVQI